MAASTPCPTNRALASILIFKRDPAERYIMPNTIFSSEGALLFIMVATVALGNYVGIGVAYAIRALIGA